MEIIFTESSFPWNLTIGFLRISHTCVKEVQFFSLHPLRATYMFSLTFWKLKIFLAQWWLNRHFKTEWWLQKLFRASIWVNLAFVAAILSKIKLLNLIRLSLYLGWRIYIGLFLLRSLWNFDFMITFEYKLLVWIS